MFGLEKELLEQLLVLRDEHGLKGVKAEFEAEGSSFNDLVRLRRLTLKAGVELHLKIGGVEAVRDIKDAVELGVDGIIAPMVETRFGLMKFIEAMDKIYGHNPVHKAINIETRNSVEELDDILDAAQGRIDSITLGRTDLSASYFLDAVVPDSAIILETAEKVGIAARDHGLGFTMGGSVSVKTLAALMERPALMSVLSKVETRKVMLPSCGLIAKPEGLSEALYFEELYILSKKEIGDAMVAEELERLSKLKERAGRKSKRAA